MKKKCLIIANGDFPGIDPIRYFQKSGFSTIVCADGGVNALPDWNLIPDYIIGDLDSAGKDVLEYYSDKSQIIKIERQDDTDVEKCLKYVIELGFTDCLMTGVTGNRLDHSFANIGIGMRFSAKINLFIHHRDSIMFFLSDVFEFTAEIGESVSVFGFDDKTLFTSEGLKYKLENIPLQYGVRESSSNEASAEKVKINTNGGRGALVRSIEVLRKYGNFPDC